MLTLKDCIDFAGLTPEQVKAIAERENLPEIMATSLGSRLMETQHGRDELKNMLREELDLALARGDKALAAELQLGLDDFVRSTAFH